MSPAGVRAVIRGTGSSLPERILHNTELEKMVDTSDEWITTRTGIRERRVAGEDEPLSLFAAAAGEAAMKSAILPSLARELASTP